MDVTFYRDVRDLITLIFVELHRGSDVWPAHRMDGRREGRSAGQPDSGTAGRTVQRTDERSLSIGYYRDKKTNKNEGKKGKEKEVRISWFLSSR